MVFKTEEQKANYVPPGVEIAEQPNGWTTIRLHYTADPDKRSAAWKKDAFRGMKARDIEREYEINWTIASGRGIFVDDFNRDLHVAKESIEPVEGRPLILMFDFGLTPACVAGQMMPTQRFNVLREWVTWDGRGEMKTQGMEKLIEKVCVDLNRDFNGYELEGYADPAGWKRSEADEKTAIDIILRALPQMILQPGPVTFSARRDATEWVLCRMIEGQPMLRIDPSCVMVANGFGGAYKFSQIGEGETAVYDNKPMKNAWSHPCEAVTYGLGGLFYHHTDEYKEEEEEEEQDGSGHIDPHRGSRYY